MNAWRVRDSNYGIVAADAQHATAVRRCLTGRGYNVLN
jgi:hypothetical protein